jgi:hypothetical protein
VTVKAKADQDNLVLALWNIGRAWRKGQGWWNVERGKARFVPVRAPFTGNLNGLLVANIVKGENAFAVTIKTPPRRLVRSTIRIGDSVEGRVFRRDGQTMAYLWPTRPWSATLVVNVPPGKRAAAFIAPAGERKPLATGPNRLEIPAGRWLRLVGLSADEIAPAKQIQGNRHVGRAESHSGNTNR